MFWRYSKELLSRDLLLLLEVVVVVVVEVVEVVVLSFPEDQILITGTVA